MSSATERSHSDRVTGLSIRLLEINSIGDVNTSQLNWVDFSAFTVKNGELASSTQG